MGRLRIDLKKGEAKVVNFTIKDKNTMETLNVSGATFVFNIREDSYSTENLVSTSGNEFTMTDPTNGLVSATISEIDSDQEAGTYVGELKILFTNGTIIKSPNIEVIIEDSIT